MRHLAALVLSALLLTGCGGRPAVPVIAVAIPKTAAITRAVKALEAPVKNGKVAADATVFALEALKEAEKPLDLAPESPLALATITLEAKARASAQLAADALAAYQDVAKENTLLNQDVEKAQKVSRAAAIQSADFQSRAISAEAHNAFWRKWCLIGWAIICMATACLVLAFLYRTTLTAAIKGAKFGI